MAWTDEPPTYRHAAETVCTDKQLAAIRLYSNGAGYKRIALILNISPSTARDRIRDATRKIRQELDHQTKETAA